MKHIIALTLLVLAATATPAFAAEKSCDGDWQPTAKQTQFAAKARAIFINMGISVSNVLPYCPDNAADRDELLVGYTLMSEPLAVRLAKNGMLPAAKLAGYKAILFSDDAGEMWRFDTTTARYTIGTASSHGR